MKFLRNTIFMFCAIAVGSAPTLNAMTIAQQSDSSLLCPELKTTFLSLFTKNAHHAVQPILVPTVAHVFEAPVAPVVVQPVWDAVRDNAKETLENIWHAGCNVMSYVPYALRQVTHETKVLAHALKDMPLTSTALIVAAAYGCWKAYKWYKQPRIQQVVEDVHSRVVRSQWRNGHPQ